MSHHESGTMDVTVNGQPARRPFTVNTSAPIGYQYEPELKDGEQLVQAIGDDPTTARIISTTAGPVDMLKGGQARVTYIGEGPLKGKTALALGSYRGEPAGEGCLFLQFDDLTLEVDGVSLAHGWHEYKSSLLSMDKPSMEQEWGWQLCHCGCGQTLDQVREADPHA